MNARCLRLRKLVTAIALCTASASVVAGCSSNDGGDPATPDAGRLRPTPADGGAMALPDGACPEGVEFCMPPPPPPDEMQDCTPDELVGRSWCDPATWGGVVPDATTDLSIPSGEVILLDCAAEAHSIDIEEGGVLRASHDRASSLVAHGNIVVHGRLELGRPGCRIPEGVTTEIVFTGMSDNAYAGTPTTAPYTGDMHTPSALTPMDAIASDIGLWVLGRGVFVGGGATKRAWGFLTEGAAPGDATFTVEDATGWAAGDRVVLTPSAMRSEADHTEQFDETMIASVSGNAITLAAPPSFTHAGCPSCMRRSEAIDLTRNVAVRSADDSAHAHVMIANEALLQLDSVELRWLGPEWTEDGGRCGGPDRRAPIWFHQQEGASDASFVRHVAIWGGQNHFLMVERSNGIEIADVAGYDTFGSGMSLFYDSSTCGTRCNDREVAPSDLVLTGVIVAKVGVNRREEGCLRINHRMSGIVVSGGDRSGCSGCVATGVGYVGGGADISGFEWAEGGSGRPLEFTFTNNVAHNNGNHGAFIWHNGAMPQAPYTGNQFWSNDGYGIHWGAYNNAFVLEDFTAVDNGLASVGVKAIPADERPRLDGATIDDLKVLAYVLVQGRANILRDLQFTGARPLAITQIHDRCTAGDETDPDDPECTRIWLHIENPTFAPGVVPFDFGWTFNRNSVWEVRGFSHPDAAYRDLPPDFDLYRSDNHVAGGYLHDGFGAWLVPR